MPQEKKKFVHHSPGVFHFPCPTDLAGAQATRTRMRIGEGGPR